MRFRIIGEDGREYWTASQSAQAIGVASDTFTAYVSRSQAPGPVDGFFVGHRLWLADEVRAWDAARPSRRRG